MDTRWDVIIVGARCAGATLAALTARAGMRTLLLEVAKLGSDMPLSTHLMQSHGMDVLDRLGLGDRVRAVSPPTRVLRLALDEVEIFGRYPEQRAAYCIRRSTLDPWLQEAAQTAGAELRDRHRVVDLIREHERVIGVVAESPAGTTRFFADLVVGADGPHSTIAELTGVEEYLVTHGTRGAYWNYFPAPARWAAAWDATLEHRGDHMRCVFRCDADLVLLASSVPLAEVATWRQGHREKLRHHLAQSETTRALCETHEPVGKGCGLIKNRFFYRRPVGPGFALVGDAGHVKDFVTGQGMADALLDAEQLSVAIQHGTKAAFEQYWRARDVATLPLHYDAIRQGRVGFNNAFTRWIFAQLHARPDLEQRLGLLLDRRIDPNQLVPARTVLVWMGAALLRGRFDVLGGLAGAQNAAEQRELTQRRALLQASLAVGDLPGARPRRSGNVSRMRGSTLYLGATADYEARMRGAARDDVTTLHCHAQRIAWAIVLRERVGLDLDREVAALLRRCNDHFAAHVTVAFARRAQCRAAEADAHLARARELAQPDHPWAQLIPDEASWRANPRPHLEADEPGRVWRVHSHGPQGEMLSNGGVARFLRMRSGELVYLNPIELSPALLEQVRGLGDVTHVIAPAKFHSDFVPLAMSQFPKARAFGVAAHRGYSRVAHIKFHGYLDDDAPLFPDELDQVTVRGAEFGDVLLIDRTSRTLIVTDAFFSARLNEENRPFATAFGVFYMWAWGVFDRLGIPSYQPATWTDIRAYQASLRRLLGYDFDHLASCHGSWRCVNGDAKATFEREFGWLLSLGKLDALGLLADFARRHPKVFMKLGQEKFAENRALKRGLGMRLQSQV